MLTLVHKPVPCCMSYRVQASGSKGKAAPCRDSDSRPAADLAQSRLLVADLRRMAKLRSPLALRGPVKDSGASHQNCLGGQRAHGLPDKKSQPGRGAQLCMLQDMAHCGLVGCGRAADAKAFDSPAQSRKTKWLQRLKILPILPCACTNQQHIHFCKGNAQRPSIPLSPDLLKASAG